MPHAPPYATCFGPEPFASVEADRAHLGRDLLRLLVATGKVRRLVQGAYVDALVPDSLGLRSRAVAKVAPEDAVVCGRTAAWLWGVDAQAMGAHVTAPPVDLMRPAGASASRRKGAFGCTGPIRPDDVVVLHGVAVTTPARTAADLARLLARPDALAALDVLVGLPGVTVEAVRAVLDRFAGHRGVIQGRELAALADPRSESPQESRTRLRCVDAGFPCPEPQIVVCDRAGSFVARLDLGWRERLKALEFDGDKDHASRAAQQHDRARRRRVEDCGWGLAVVTSGQVLSRSLAFERGVGELLGLPMRLTRHHPRYGGWEPRSRWAST